MLHQESCICKETSVPRTHTEQENKKLNQSQTDKWPLFPYSPSFDSPYLSFKNKILPSPQTALQLLNILLFHAQTNSNPLGSIHDSCARKWSHCFRISEQTFINPNKAFLNLIIIICFAELLKIRRILGKVGVCVTP